MESSYKLKEDISYIKNEMIIMSGGYDDGFRYGTPMVLEYDNASYGLELFDTRGEGERLRKNINETRKRWITILGLMEGPKYLSRKDNPIKFDSISLIRSGVRIMEHIPEKQNIYYNEQQQILWYIDFANDVPVAAFLPKLSQIQHDILSSELEMLSYLKSKLECHLDGGHQHCCQPPSTNDI